ncbi:MAG TPA: hypothetical protein VFH90_05705 [Candidatus Limnocylindria bacterium]|nr:hypothetical protein [Candidatus Limnocylindria bacterium]
MTRSIRALILATAATLALAGTAAAEPISEPASCSGYLASYANPNNAFIIHELVKPAADALEVPMGQVIVGQAQEHEGSLEACIPD